MQIGAAPAIWRISCQKSLICNLEQSDELYTYSFIGHVGRVFMQIIQLRIW